MASIQRVKEGWVVEIELRGTPVLAKVTGAAEQVRPRFYELPVMIPNRPNYIPAVQRVTARQVRRVYRPLAS